MAMDLLERRLRTSLMKFAGHRDRIELALPARMLWQCAYSITHTPGMPPDTDEKAFCKAVMPALEQALLEPLNGITPSKRGEAAAMINGTSDWTLQIFKGRPVPTVFMITLRWLEGMVNSGYLVLAKNSACDQALDLILGELIKCPELGDINRTSMKNSHRLLERLHSLGLYKEAAMPQADKDTLTFTTS